MIDLLLPCLDEAAALPYVLGRIPDGMHAIVIDNGSTDGSAQLARSLGATVVGCATPGYGAACHAGLLASRADIVVFCDCDASIDPQELIALIDLVAHRGVDLAVGRRRPVSRTAWPAHARIPNTVLSALLRRRGIPVHDIAPVRVGRREALLHLGVQDRRSGYPLEVLVRAAEAGWTIQELPIPYRPREGRSKVTGTARGTLRAVHDMGQVLRG